MDRNSLILRFVDKEMLGVEIGPWHSPIAPKALGYDCLSLDVADTETLRRERPLIRMFQLNWRRELKRSISLVPPLRSFRYWTIEGWLERLIT